MGICCWWQTCYNMEPFSKEPVNKKGWNQEKN